MENRQVEHKASIIEMDNKLCDQVISMLIDPGYNYRYVTLYLVDKCGLSKELQTSYTLSRGYTFLMGQLSYCMMDFS